jgi:hypothetical protein
MPKIIKRKRHYLTRFPIWFVAILFFALSPYLIGVLGSWLTELSTGQPCHEGNCGWMVLPFFTFITLPMGALGLLIFLVIVLQDSLEIWSKSR